MPFRALASWPSLSDLHMPSGSAPGLALHCRCHGLEGPSPPGDTQFFCPAPRKPASGNEPPLSPSTPWRPRQAGILGLGDEAAASISFLLILASLPSGIGVIRGQDHHHHHLSPHGLGFNLYGRCCSFSLQELCSFHSPVWSPHLVLL
jgi:hypothetical protein